MSQIIEIPTNAKSETEIMAEGFANGLMPKRQDSKKETDEKTMINPEDYKPIVEFMDKTDEEIISLAEKRIESQSNISSGPVPAILIYKWVVKELKNNVEFAKRTLIKSKSLQKSFDYVMSIAESRAKKQAKMTGANCCCVGMSDDEILELIKEYYNLNDYELDKKKAEEKAKAEANRKAKEAERKAKSKSSSTQSKKTKKAEKTQKSTAEKKKDEQPDLFSMLGGC